MAKRKRKTAAELMAELSQDEEYQALRRAKDEELAQRVAEWHRAEAPLREELRSVGFELESAWDLVSTPEAYPSAVPILLDHLSRPYPSRVREGIVRALTAEFARGVAGQPLVEAFENETDAKLRWVIGNALSVVATSEEYDDVLRLVDDRSFGHSRGMLLDAVARLGGAKAISILIPLLDDPDVAANAVIALGQLKAVEARDRIAEFKKHDDPWVRDKAKKALKRIDSKMH